ncbi:MAG: DUF4350 domain-containing protein [Gammaproteobacteria bacterium]
MKERLITLMCAIGALLLFITLFVKRDSAMGGRNEIPRPTTAEHRGNGYNAAMSWLEAEGVRNVSLRDRFDSLAKRTDLSQGGNLLIVTLPAATDFNTWEFIPLDRWIRAGNTLLVLAALSDNPDWAFSQGAASGDVNLLTGLEFETARFRDERLRKRERPPQPGTRPKSAQPAAPPVDDAENSGKNPKIDVAAAFRSFAEPRRTTLVPNRAHAYFTGVRSVVSLSDYPQRTWTVKVPYEGFVLALGHEQESGEGVLWTRPLGKGRIIVSGFGSVFTNRALGLGDNARLLANIIGVNVSQTGTVLFDDLHQGLGASYDPDKFYKDRRLYITVGVLLALWFIWVLGSTRLRAPASRNSIPREAELIRAAGGFFSRALPAHAGARRLLENFFRRVSARAGDRRGSAVPWDILERSAHVAPADLEQLRAWYTDAYASRRVPLEKLQNLIVRIDRQMAT